MALSETPHEPTMEEILASIRRIISSPEGEEPPPALELTEIAAPDPAPAMDEDPLVEETFGESGSEFMEEAEELMVVDREPEAPEPMPVKAALPPMPSPKPKVADSGLLGEPAATAAAGAISRLVGSMALSNVPHQTLEGVVQELLRPMLKTWLDEHLPAIVEAKVEAELERVSRLSR